MDDKKSRKTTGSGRPYLLRRSTASGTGGSIKRRSFRFRKSGNKDSTKEGNDQRKTSSKESGSDSKKGGMKDAFKEKFGDSRKSDSSKDSHECKKGSGKDTDLDREFFVFSK